VTPHRRPRTRFGAAMALALALTLPAVALTACGNKEGSGGDIVKLTAKDSDTTKEVALGEVIDIELEQKTASTGYTWQVKEDGSPALEELPSITEAPTGPPGASGSTVLRFKAVEVGQGLVEAQYVGPGTDAEVAQTVTYNFAVVESLAGKGAKDEKSDK
jgi:predicted secreted protein